jgi:hypothetical protein
MRVAQLKWGNIDRQRQWIWNDRCGSKSLLKYLPGEIIDPFVLLRELDELVRWNEPCNWMLPSGKHLKTCQLATT